MPHEPKAADAADKPNKGQDEQTHTFVNDAGEERTETQRWFRSEGRDAGFRRVEETDAAAEAEPVAEVE